MRMGSPAFDKNSSPRDRGAASRRLVHVALVAAALLVVWVFGRSLPREGAARPGARISVSAASSLRDVLTRLASRYEESHPGTRVRMTFGASNVLARQIVNGAPVDVFFSADGRAMDALERAGRLVSGSRIDLLSNAIVILVPEDAPLAIHGPADLLSPRLRRIAL